MSMSASEAKPVTFRGEAIIAFVRGRELWYQGHFCPKGGPSLGLFGQELAPEHACCFGSEDKELYLQTVMDHKVRQGATSERDGGLWVCVCVV